MINPILSQANNPRNNVNNVMNNQLNPQAIQQIKGVMNQIKMAQNPQYALTQMFLNNPQLSQVINFIKSSGGDMQQAFYNLAKQMNINPQDVLNQLK